MKKEGRINLMTIFDAWLIIREHRKGTAPQRIFCFQNKHFQFFIAVKQYKLGNFINFKEIKRNINFDKSFRDFAYFIRVFFMLVLGFTNFCVFVPSSFNYSRIWLNKRFGSVHNFIDLNLEMACYRSSLEMENFQEEEEETKRIKEGF